MKSHSFFRFGAGITVLTFATVLSKSVQAQVAQDNADNADCPRRRAASILPTLNGGFGYGLWTPLSDGSGGGTYMEGIGMPIIAGVDGNYSFALLADGRSCDIIGPLSSSMTSGDFSITTRFDLAGTGPNLVNLRVGNNTSSFGSGELLSFGIVGGNELSYTDSTGFHLLSSGEARGNVRDWRG